MSSKRETNKVHDGREFNYDVELFDGKKWQYITCEDSVSDATDVAMNLHIVTNINSRVMSKRSKTILFQAI